MEKVIITKDEFDFLQNEHQITVENIEMEVGEKYLLTDSEREQVAVCVFAYNFSTYTKSIFAKCEHNTQKITLSNEGKNDLLKEITCELADFELERRHNIPIENMCGEDGCSVCVAGEENYTTFRPAYRPKQKFYQYDYRTPSGELFSAIAPTLEECRKQRDKWLEGRLNINN